MDKRLTLEEAQSKIDNLNLDFEILEYNPKGQKSKFKHSCGHIFETRLSHLLNRNRCPICNGKWRNKEMFQEESDKIHNKEYEILEFKSGNDPVKIKHKTCGTIFSQIGNKHLSGQRCFECYGNKKLSKKDILERSKEIWNDEYEFLSQNINYTKKSLIRHKKCGYEYYQIVSSHLFGYGCPMCAGNAPLTKQMVQEKSNNTHNNEYEILSEPNGAFSKVQIKHKRCGNIITQSVTDHIQGRGCNCLNNSRGEKAIISILEEKNILFEKEKSFIDCKFKNKLRFDFYLPDYNICIEYDGIQHFKPISWFGGDKFLRLQKIKDVIKTKYCLDNSIELIRFNYLQSVDEIKGKILSELKKFAHL